MVALQRSRCQPFEANVIVFTNDNVVSLEPCPFGAVDIGNVGGDPLILLLALHFYYPDQPANCGGLPAGYGRGGI